MRIWASGRPRPRRMMFLANLGYDRSELAALREEKVI